MKVAIIGAGIVGLYLAQKLAEKGEEVFVFEKRKKIGKKPCSGLYSERLFNFFPQAKKFIENEINYCLIHFPKKTIKVEFKNKFFVIEREILDKIAYSLAKNSGAKIFLGREIKKLPEDFDLVIGTDGASSQVRKILKLKNPEFFLGILGYEIKKGNSNFIETWPTKEGFLWKIPKRKKLEWGIIEKPKRARELFENFIKNKGIKIEKINSAPIPQGFLIPDNKNITLCGDATGITKPWSGGGVIWGLTAAEILLKNFPDFLKYKKEVKKFFLKHILFSKLLKKIIYFLGFKFPYFLPSKFKIDGDFLFYKITTYHCHGNYN